MRSSTLLFTYAYATFGADFSNNEARAQTSAELDPCLSLGRTFRELFFGSILILTMLLNVSRYNSAVQSYSF